MASGRETARRGAECRSAVCSHEPTSLQHDIICAVKGGEAQQKGSRRPGLGSTVDAIVKGLSTLCPQNCKDLVRLFSRTSTETTPPFGKKTMQR